MSKEIKNIEKVKINGKKMYRINDTLYPTLEQANYALALKQANSIEMSEDRYYQNNIDRDIFSDIRDGKVLHAYATF